MTCWHRSRNVLTHGLFFKRVAIKALHMARDMFASLPPRSGRWFQLMTPTPGLKKVSPTTPNVSLLHNAICAFLSRFLKFITGRVQCLKAPDAT